MGRDMAKGNYLAEFEQVVLLALARIDGDAYGMTIHDEIHSTTGRESSIPSVYVTLGRLEQKGYVSSYTGEPSGERGGRAKKYFRLEEAGTEALQRSRQLLDQLWQGVDLAADGRRS
jgi:DNA-binding PadR family transcriptional regulator